MTINFSTSALVDNSSKVYVDELMYTSPHDKRDANNHLLYMDFQNLDDHALVKVLDFRGVTLTVTFKEAKENFYALWVGDESTKKGSAKNNPMLFAKVPELTYASVNDELKHMGLISIDYADNHDPHQFAKLKAALIDHASKEEQETNVMSEPDFNKKIHAATDARLAARKNVEDALNTLIGNDSLRVKKPIDVAKVQEPTPAANGNGQGLSPSQSQQNTLSAAGSGTVASLVSPEVLRMHGLPEDFLTSDSDFYMLVLMALKTEKSRKSALALKGLQDNTSLLKSMNDTISSITAAINSNKEAPKHYFEYQGKWYLSGGIEASKTKIPSGVASIKLEDVKDKKILEEMQRFFTNETTVFQNTQQLLLSSVQDQMGKEQTFASLMSDLCKQYQQMRDTPVSKMA
jgi:hypothetical protein